MLSVLRRVDVEEAGELRWPSSNTCGSGSVGPLLVTYAAG